MNDEKPVASIASVKESNTPKVTKKIIVQAGDSAAVLIASDQEGAELFFDGRENFVSLTDVEVRQLSTENKRRYSMAQQQHEIWMKDESVRLEDEFSSVQFTGRATDKINSFVGDPNFKYRWTDPMKIGQRQQIGWTLCTKGEVQTFLGPTKNHHEIGNMGKTELVLMKMPKALWDKRQQAKVEKNKAAASSAVQQFDENARRAGVQVVDDNPKDGRDWQEQPGV